MPRYLPDSPTFASAAERQVWKALQAGLGPGDLLIANQRLTDGTKDHELDLVVGLEGAGIVVVEVKGGSVWHDGYDWRQSGNGVDKVIHPVDQARDGCYALRGFLENDLEWRTAARSRVRWGHAVVLPFTSLPADFSAPDLPRWAAIDRDQVSDVAGCLRAVIGRQTSGNRSPDADDLAILADALAGRGMPQRDVVALAAEREAAVDQLTEQQSLILGAARLLPRIEVRGGAGSGKTWMALEQARRLEREGQRVALLCYSLGLASYLRRVTDGWKHKDRPSYVGTFHDLGQAWGSGPHRDRNDSDYWERDLPQRMTELAAELPAGHRFDAIVVDEAQDFAASWWEPLVGALHDLEGGKLYVFSDEGQKVFARYAPPPLGLVPLILDDNLRNTRQIADVFHPLVPQKMRLRGGEGPAVRTVVCSPAEALGAADDAVDALLDEGWRPQDVALLTTGSRHPEQAARQEVGQDAYWESFWDADQVFYGHVLGFKGLERSAVVLALNEGGSRDRARERLYVGLSRARDLLVVCGDPDVVRAVGGDDVAKRLGL